VAPDRVDEAPQQQLDEKWATVRVKESSNLTGIALSGGGIRSASFCLGVLQALDSLSKRDEPQVLDAVDYLSAVSGGQRPVW
jgi:predicted acylesterase/phospholipase RssA